MKPLPSSFVEYLDDYIADLLEPLTGAQRKNIRSSLAIGYVGGPYPRRDMVQRLVEATVGRITTDQYLSWVLSFDRSGDATVDHVLSCLSEGVFVGGDRDTMLRYLANIEATPSMPERLNAAVKVGLLTDQERVDVLTQAFSHDPIPPIVALPAGLLPMPEDFPEPRKDTGMQIAPPGEAVFGRRDFAAFKNARADLKHGNGSAIAADDPTKSDNGYS